MESQKLCLDCRTFNGNPDWENLCSSCYKKKYGELKKKDEKKVIEIVCEQDDHKKCWSCKKKVGYLGIKCKCSYTFCSKHRLPEDHECQFNHAEVQRKLLEQQNPEVKSSQINKI